MVRTDTDTVTETTRTRAVDDPPRDVPERVLRALSLLALVAVALRLFVPPLVGVADNGDGFRVMGPAGIRYLEPLGADQHRRVRARYTTVGTSLARRPSSAAFVAAAARLVPLGARGRFDLRALGIVYVALVAGALVLSHRRRAHALLALLFVLVLASPTYRDLLQSFYGDASAVAGTLCLALLASAPRATTARARASIELALLLSVALIGFSSRAHQLAPAILLVASVLSLRTTPRSHVFYAALLALSITAPWHAERGGGARFSHINGYHAVYRGIAQLADDPQDVLRALALPDASIARVGTSYYEADVPRALARRLARVRRTDVLALYLERPRAISRALGWMGRVLAARTQVDLGHDTTGRTTRPYFVEPAWSWRAIRSRALPHPGLIAIVMLLGVVVALYDRRRGRGDVMPVYLVISITTTCGIALLGDGTFSLGRHLLLAGLGLDLLLAWLVVRGGRALWRRVREHRVARGA